MNISKRDVSSISGIVQRVTYHNAESGWSVLKISPFNRPQELITVTVHQTKVFAGATIDFYGEWIQHSRYGTQFKAHRAIEKRPASITALEKYLGSGLIFGVGPKTAKKIVNTFKKDTLDIFENNIEKLTKVRGIAKTKLNQIKKAWTEHREIRNVMMFLQSYGISTLFAVKIFKKYGDQSIETVRNDPYRLSKDIYGIGFFSADKVALSLGMAKDSNKRLEAAIKHILANSREEGHCYLTCPQIIDRAHKLLDENFENKIFEILDKMEQEDELKIRHLVQNDKSIKCFYSKSLFFDELYVAQKALKLAQKRFTNDEIRAQRWIDRYSTNQTAPLSEEQKHSVCQIISQGMSILTGGPGCGKTTTVKTLVALLLAMKKNVTLAAPTGRASQRMSEVIGIEAQTIHRLLVWNPSTFGFKKNEDNKIYTDFLIVDECSMLDISLTASLLKAVDENTQLLFIGDIDQLPSVGAGNVLSDLIESKKISCYRLTKVFRQAQQSQIIKYAHQINRGHIPKIQSPFYDPKVWKNKIDTLFIDSEEATCDDLKFISRVKKSYNLKKEDATDSDQYFIDEFSPKEIEKIKQGDISQHIFHIPTKFKHVNIDDLLKANTHTDEIRSVLKKIHPWSTLNYSLTATDMILRLYQQTIPKYFGKEKEIQILTPMTRGNLGTHRLNHKIQAHCNPKSDDKKELLLGDKVFRIGDRVIQKKNNYDLEVFNGDIGAIKTIDSQTIELLVEFPDQKKTKEVIYKKEHMVELDLSYAITIHKSQGSEFDIVIIPVVTQHFKMLFRNLIYTGLTRAKKLAIFIGTRKALSIAIKNVDNRVRQTLLKEIMS